MNVIVVFLFTRAYCLYIVMCVNNTIVISPKVVKLLLGICRSEYCINWQLVSNTVYLYKRLDYFKH